MTREEREAAIAYIKGYRKLDEDLHNNAPKDSISYYATEKCLKYWDMAIQALSQEPCDDTVSIRKDILKCRVGKIVAYNVEWLREHWQMEMDIVCGVKPCDDAISRDAVIKLFNGNIGSEAALILHMVKQLPSVTQKSGKWIYSDLLRVKHGTMNIDALINKVYADMREEQTE